MGDNVDGGNVDDELLQMRALTKEKKKQFVCCFKLNAGYLHKELVAQKFVHAFF